MPLLATFNPTLSYVQLDGNGMPNISGMPVYVERKLPTELAWTGVRTGTPVAISGSSFQIFDYEFVPNVQNDYRVRTSYIFDTFNRTRTDVWGYTDSGLLWSHNGVGTAANWDVNGTVGTYTMADAVTTQGGQALSAVALLDVDLRGVIKISATPTVAPLQAFFRTRGGTNNIVLRGSFTTAGNLDITIFENGVQMATLPSALGAAINTDINLRFQVQGQTYRTKVWFGAATAEPAAWTLTAAGTLGPAAGDVRFEGTRATGNTNVNPVLSLENFWADDMATSSTKYSYLGGDSYLLDTFTRTVANGWGLADSGQAYTLSGAAANYSVSAANGGVIGNLTTTAQTAITPATGTDQDIYVDIRNPQAALTQSIQGGPVLRYVDSNNMYRALLSFTVAGNIDLFIVKNVAGVVTTIATATTAVATYSIGAFYRVRFQADGTLLRAKIWLSTTTEPQSWNLEIIDASLAAAGNVGVRVLLVAGNTNVTPEMRFDNLSAANFADSAVESVTPLQNTVWLKFPLRPNLNMQIELCNWSPERRLARGALFEVQGRKLPVAVTDVRRGREFDVVIRADDSTEAEAIELVLSTGDVVLLQTPGPTTVCGLNKRRYPAQGYFYVGDLTSTRVIDGRFTQALEAEFTETAGPDPSNGGTTTTWQAIINNFATWTAVQSTFATWQAVQNYLASPADVIVG